jgi:hypothetical protein
MNARPPSASTVLVYSIAILGSFLIVAGMVWVLYSRTRPAPLNQARISERIQGLREIRATSGEALQNFGWQNQAHGVVRLPITNAMELIVREWQDPQAGRSNLLARLERATPPPPPPPEEEEPNPFE